MAIIDWLNDNKDNISFKLNDKGFVEFSFIKPPKPITDKTTLLELIKVDAYIIKFASPKLTDDMDVANAALSKSPFSLKYLSDNLRNNIELIEDCLEKTSLSSNAYDLISSSGESIKKNREFIEKFLNKPHINGRFFRFVASYHKDDRELNLLAVKRGLPLRYIDKQYALDREFVIEFIKQKAENIKNVHPCFRFDEEIAITSVKYSKGKSYKFLDQTLAIKHDVIIAALKEDRNNFFSIPYSYRIEISEQDPQKFIDSLLLSDELKNSLNENTENGFVRKPKL